MSDMDMAVQGIAQLIEIVSGGAWKASDNAAQDQARQYVGGVRDGRIADVTFQAVTLARMIARPDDLFGVVSTYS